MNLASKIILSVGFVVVSCSAPRVVQDYQRDSVVLVVKDSVILKDSVVLVEIPMESDKSVVIAADTSFLETSVAWSQAFVNEGKLYHTLTNKDALLPVSITIPTNVHAEQREKAMIIRQTIEVEKELSRWQNFVQMLGYGMLVAAALWLARMVARILSMGR